jgi:hypothetical protein
MLFPTKLEITERVALNEKPEEGSPTIIKSVSVGVLGVNSFIFLFGILFYFL